MALSPFGESLAPSGVNSPTHLCCGYAHGVPQHLMPQQQQGEKQGQQKAKGTVGRAPHEDGKPTRSLLPLLSLGRHKQAEVLRQARLCRPKVAPEMCLIGCPMSRASRTWAWLSPARARWWKVLVLDLDASANTAPHFFGFFFFLSLDS